MEGESAGVGIKAIGVVRSEFTACGQAPKQGPSEPTTSVIELHPAYVEGAADMREGDYFWVLCRFEDPDDLQMMVHPRGNRALPRRGLFTTRSPRRPAPISLTLVRLEKIKGGRLTVRGLEMLDGTPVLDIKPYVAKVDQPPE